jgi:hypothetical protein
MDAVEAPENKITTDAGGVSFRKVQKFEVIDIAKVPAAYILPNEVAIRGAMKLGKEIPGVRYYFEEIPYNAR